MEFKVKFKSHSYCRLFDKHPPRTVDLSTVPPYNSYTCYTFHQSIIQTEQWFTSRLKSLLEFILSPIKHTLNFYFAMQKSNHFPWHFASCRAPLYQLAHQCSATICGVSQRHPSNLETPDLNRPFDQNFSVVRSHRDR